MISGRPSLLSPHRFLKQVCALLGLGILLSHTALLAGDAPEALVARLRLSEGWISSEPARVAAGDGLFQLIDGGAEVYHEYGFNRAVSWSIENSSGASIQIELYEMNDAAAAFGVWSLMQTGNYTRGKLGQGSLRFRYYVAFWSGSYFGTVTAAQLNPNTQAEVDLLAAQLAASLPLTGELPDWFSQLPSDGLKEKMYFRGKIGLSNTPVNAAGEIVEGKEGLVGIYPDHRSLLYHFRSVEEARACLGKIRHDPKSRSLKTATPEADGLSGVLADGSPFKLSQKGTALLLSLWPVEEGNKKSAPSP